MNGSDLAARTAAALEQTTPPAVRAIEVVLDRLELAGVPATRDAGAFHPQGLGVLVGLPLLTARGLALRTYSVPVRVVSSDPLNSVLAVDSLYLLADELAGLLDADAYVPQEWQGGVNRDPLPAVLLEITVSISEG
jgi:hypothetical protein